MKQMKNIAIFASGNGSNAENIAKYFSTSQNARVRCVLSNRETAYVHQRMNNHGIPSVTFKKTEWESALPIMEYLATMNIDLIVLSGFLAIVRPPIIEAYSGRIINIHPSLLPKFGGQGMWGMNVHRAVVESKSTESGITIHYVSNVIDGGEIILQKSCPVLPEDTPEMVATHVHELEYTYFPVAIEMALSKIDIFKI